jgi:zinc D-Ala-D-Ala carboxypeptidase
VLPFLRATALAVILGTGLLTIPASRPQPALALGPLPTCRLDDILTSPRDYDSWSVTLVDWILDVGPEYVPPDLVSVSAAGVTGGGQIRKVAFDDLKAMAQAARAHRTPLGNVSAYRSYPEQKVLFDDYARDYGYRKAITFSARPGHSEHQLGLTIDFAPAGASDFVSEEFGAGKWLSSNAWKYGWLMSYPKGKKPVTCYRYEPWHYRYVGRDLAKQIHDSGLTIREYLWSHDTTAEVPAGTPSASGSPTGSPGDSAVPSGPPASTADAPPSPGDGESAGAPGAPVGGVSPSPGAVEPAGAGTAVNVPTAIVGAVLLVGLVAAIGAIGLRRRPRNR